MALSPQYGWAEPDNSSLVKNGAADIRTLGDSIDTSLWNVGYGQAGKNKIINGDFGIWQRGTSFNITGNFSADRWFSQPDVTPTTGTVSQQTFTPGTAPVAGYESAFFLRSSVTTAGSCTVVSHRQRIENVRTFAGNTVTVSLWAKADTAGRIIQFPQFQQNFGSGGSASVPTYGSNITLTTSWARYTQTFSIPSISGKTIGTSSYLEFLFQQPIVSGATLDIWGVQIEYGSKATPFQLAGGGDPQSELAMCQRYYERVAAGSGAANDAIAWGVAGSSTAAVVFFPMKVTKRIFATVIDWSSLRTVNYNTSGTVNLATPSAIAASPGGTNIFTILVTTTGMSTGLPVWLDTTGTTGFLGISAEL